MDVALAYNPLAGSHDPGRVTKLAEALRNAGHQVEILDSRAAKSSPKARAADLLCVAGGDGTLRDLICGWDAGALPRLGVYPMGTINLVAREAGYPGDPRAFAQRATTPRARKHYIARVGDLAFLACASIGPDSFAVHGVSPGLKRRFGRLAYGIALCSALLRWPRVPMRISVDGRRHVGEAVYALKGRYFAGPWTLAPEASLQEPRLQILILPRARRRDFARLVIATMFSVRFADPAWQRLSAESVTVEADQPAPVQADGDIIAHLPVRIVVEPSPLEFV